MNVPTFNFESLPLDLQKHVLSFANTSDHAKMAQASKKTDALVEHSPLWHKLCIVNYPEQEKPAGASWKSHLKVLDDNILLRMGSFLINIRDVWRNRYDLNVNQHNCKGIHLKKLFVEIHGEQVLDHYMQTLPPFLQQNRDQFKITCQIMKLVSFRNLNDMWGMSDKDDVKDVQPDTFFQFRM